MPVHTLFRSLTMSPSVPAQHRNHAALRFFRTLLEDLTLKV